MLDPSGPYKGDTDTNTTYIKRPWHHQENAVNWDLDKRTLWWINASGFHISLCTNIMTLPQLFEHYTIDHTNPHLNTSRLNILPAQEPFTLSNPPEIKQFWNAPKLQYNIWRKLNV